MTEIKFVDTADFDSQETLMRTKYRIPRKGFRASDGVLQPDKTGTEEYSRPLTSKILVGIFATYNDIDITEEALESRLLTDQEKQIRTDDRKTGIESLVVE